PGIWRDDEILSSVWALVPVRRASCTGSHLSWARDTAMSRMTSPGSSSQVRRLCRVVENNADCVTLPRPDAADAVPQVHAIRTARALHGPVVNRENNAVALAERHDHRAALHARALFRHDELSTGEGRA